MPRPEGLISISANCSGLAFSKPCASRGAKPISRPELRRITIRLLRRSYRAAVAEGPAWTRRVARFVALANSSCEAMDPLPFAAQRCQTARQLGRIAGGFAPWKPVILAQLNRARRAVQAKNRFAAVSNDMYMRRAMDDRSGRPPPVTRPGA